MIVGKGNWLDTPDIFLLKRTERKNQLREIVIEAIKTCRRYGTFTCSKAKQSLNHKSSKNPEIIFLSQFNSSTIWGQFVTIRLTMVTWKYSDARFSSIRKELNKGSILSRAREPARLGGFGEFYGRDVYKRILEFKHEAQKSREERTVVLEVREPTPIGY